ncbi:kinase-like domain-containing protein [Morchella snyderi]|nr:kinase-like domain-containing protein [Morchella snyderi]
MENIQGEAKILTSMDPNQRPARRQRAAAPKLTAPSPLKKQSDYHLVAPLKAAATKALAPSALTGPSKRSQHTGAPKTPKQTSKERNKKFLCATPPTVLQDTRGKTEYGRGRQLGEGGFARCFLVQNKEGGLFAAKTVAKKSLQSQKKRAKFFGEIQVHKTMIHPNIVKFIECFEDPDNIYMILELCPNKSLMDMLRARKRFTEPETRFFVLQLLGALKYMHGKRVIHRDLKLGNIFLDENMNVKLGDFGLAALLVDENDRKKTICGTPNYIAPEVLFGGGKEGQGHSFEVDLWGVGVIMYAMLVGRTPFQANDVDSIYRKIRHNTFTWPEDVPVSSAAKSLVNSILEHDPEARPSLDDVANHRFFKSGFFPRSIPSSATKQEPIWRGTTGQGTPKEDVKEPASESSGPVIPFTPVLNSKIGNSIPSTTTSAIIASLQSYIQNFSAFTAGKLHLLPPQPPATIEAVRSFKRGEKNSSLFITKWVDYTNKYGVAYILTDGTCVAMYNDNTSLVVDSVGGQRVEFITQSIVDAPTGRRNNKQEVTYRRLSTTMTIMNQKKKSSRGLASKVTMWKRFGNYMKTNLGSEAEWSFTRERDHSEQSTQDPEGGMVFVTHYARLRRCAMFRFSDGGFQVGLHLSFFLGIY